MTLRVFWWSFALGLVLCMSFPNVSARAASPSLRQFRFARPLMTYLGIEGPGLRRLRPQERKKFESTLRRQVELPRFVYFRLPYGSEGEQRYLAGLAQVIRQKAKGLARMRATWNSQFQGYAVTSELLRSVQKRSFMYYLVVEKASYRRSREKWGDKWTTTHEYAFRVRVVFRRVQSFPCVQRNQNPAAQRACRGRRDDEYAAYAVPYHTVRGQIQIKRVERQKSLAVATRLLAQLLNTRLRKIKDFKLYVPVNKVDLNRVFFQLGRKEGLKLNQGFVVFERRLNGKLRRKGYVRVRTIGDNRLRFNKGRKVRVGKGEVLSSAQILTGGFGLKPGMVLYEHPMLGYSFGVLGDINFPVLGQPPNAFPFGLRFSLNGDVSDKSRINEFYWHINLDLKFNTSGNLSSEADFAGMLMFGAMKKFFFRRFGLVLLARLGGGGYPDGDTFAMALAGDLVLGFEVLLTPGLSLTLRGGFRLANLAFMSGPFTSFGLVLSL